MVKAEKKGGQSDYEISKMESWIDKEATFGALKFSALRREVHLQNEDGSVSEEIKERT